MWIRPLICTKYSRQNVGENRNTLSLKTSFLFFVIFSPFFKKAVSRDFLAFFSLIQPIWVPDKQSKMVSLKNSFLRRYSQKTWLGAVWHCAESDSAQYHTAPSREIEISENPNCLTMRQVGLRAMRYCAEFYREQFCLCRPLLAFNENITFKKNYMCTIAT